MLFFYHCYGCCIPEEEECSVLSTWLLRMRVTSPIIYIMLPQTVILSESVVCLSLCRARKRDYNILQQGTDRRQGKAR